MRIDEILESNKHNAFINVREAIEDGIVFLYPSWSIDQRYLLVLLDRLQQKQVKLPVYILDLEDESSAAFQKGFNLLSQGKGEIYFLKKGEILYRIEEHDKANPESQIDDALDRMATSQ